MNTAHTKNHKLGTFAGVFTPSVLTILGIILFLRLGYIVGSSGLRDALFIMMLAVAISVLTSFSIAAIATNLKVKGGGVYYLISRTLGAEFGGAIGTVLFLAQSVSVGFYAIGFAEATSALLGLTHPFAIQTLAAISVLVLSVIAWFGADWATRSQYIIMAVLVLALAVFVLGAVQHWNAEQLAANWTPSVAAIPFWVAFAIFFPAVTGFTQGIAMSGDLANPGRSIPYGTFAAVGLSTIVYFGFAILLAAAQPASELAADYSIMRRIAVFGPLVDAGVIAATLSSALASLVGAPRILQALAVDDVFPRIRFLAKGDGPSNNPRRAVVLATLIALAVVSLGNLNLIASVVSMFFLVSYGLLNYATYFEAKAAGPSFRPTFRFYHPYLSYVGGLGCLGVMIAIDVLSGVVAVAVVLAIHRYLSQRELPARWADSRRSYHLSLARQHLLAAWAEPEHALNWRPQLLVFSDNSLRRARLMQFASWVEGKSGLTTVVRIIAGKGTDMIAQRDEAAKSLAEELKQTKASAFPLVLLAPELDAAIGPVVQAAGVGPVRANTAVVNWHEGGPAVFGSLADARYGNNLRTVFRLGCNLLILDADSAEWEGLKDTPVKDRVIDVWWTDTPTGNLMLILAHLMTRHDDWDAATVRVLQSAQENKPEEKQIEELRAMIQEARIEAMPVVVEPDSDSKSPLQASYGSHVVFLPVTIHGGCFFHLLGGNVNDVLKDLPIAVMTMAAQDVDLDVDPDEPAAETASSDSPG